MLQGFKKGSSDNQYLFRCPYCGDSQKSQHKTRGTLYEKNGEWFYGCFNCSHGTNLYNFINFMDPSLAKKYVMETLKTSRTKRKYADQSDLSENEIKTSRLSEFTCCVDLPENHTAIKYLKGRNISDFSKIFWTPDPSTFINKNSDKKTKNKLQKIVFPLITDNGIEFGAQFRAIESNEFLRYRTCIFDKRFTKVWGMNYVDKKKRIYVLEGVMDALMVENSIAALDASLHTVVEKLKLNKDNVILVHDNEPRNKDIVKNMEKAIDGGFNVAFFPNGYQAKDLNEAKIKGLSLEFLKNNVFSGVRAKLELNIWKSV